MYMYNYLIEMVNNILGIYMFRIIEFIFKYLLVLFCLKDLG